MPWSNEDMFVEKVLLSQVTFCYLLLVLGLLRICWVQQDNSTPR